MAPKTYARWARITLLYNLPVILWGAFVRATGSGAGCGSHWPLCNGEVLPRAPETATLIELTHRITSGLTLPLVLVLLWGAFRVFPRRHPARWAAGAAVFLTLLEGAVGAGLVKFGLVADNESMARAWTMVAHLVVTFLLLAALALADYWAHGGAPISWGDAAPRTRRQLLAGFWGLMLVGASGAIAALGDTLYPAESLAHGLAQDLSPTSHLFVRLRVLHPFLAVGVGLYLLYLARGPQTAGGRRSAPAGAALAVTWLVIAQLVVGTVNVTLLAPVALQLVHLLLADLLWIAFIRLGAERLGVAPS
jgi:heme a synthase